MQDDRKPPEVTFVVIPARAGIHLDLSQTQKIESKGKLDCGFRRNDEAFILVPIPDSRFPIPDSRFPIPDSLCPFPP